MTSFNSSGCVSRMPSRAFSVRGLQAFALAGFLLAPAGDLQAHDSKPTSLSIGSHTDGSIRADGHAPIGVMGDHMHKQGEWMVSYRSMRMEMEGNRDGTDELSPEEVVTRFSNPNAPPSTLRVVPTEMTMDMHMVGAMYAPTDWLTLMAMGSYIENEMDHITFQGMSGTTRLGEFTTKSSGMGDTKLSGLVRIYEDDTHHLHLNLGVSLPTGSIDETDDVLTPMNTRLTLRLPYAMQLGSGTVDAIPGVTYTGHSGAYGWGAQASTVQRLGTNDEGYSLGDEYRATLWGSYLLTDWASVSVRLAGQSVEAIDGRDVSISAPVQTADPDNYGGERVDALVGVNLAGQDGMLRGHRLALEVGAPVYQDLNGPQMETDWVFTLGWQFAF